MRKDKVVGKPAKLNREEGLQRAAEYRKAAEIFKKGDNFELAEDCLDNAALEEAMALRGMHVALFNREAANA